jgi:uncharacterized Rossmann fold enzyme
MKTLKNKHKGKDCYIVGCGPSIQYLTKDMFKDGIVITLYESIIPVEKLNLTNTIYSMQKDRYVVEPKKAILLLHEHESKKDNPNYQHIVWDNNQLGLDWLESSGPSAVKLAEYMGCKKMYLIAFDTCTNGDTRECKATENGFEFVNEKENKNEYKIHCKRIKYLSNNVEFI